MLGSSATPFHLKSGIINIFDQHVAAAFLEPSELQRLLEPRRLITASRAMLFRAMNQRYLSPLHSYRQIRYLDNQDQTKILTRDYLRDEVEALEKLTEPERESKPRRNFRVHEPLIREMLRETERVAKVDPGTQQMVNGNRGIIFVPSISHAKIYASMLNAIGDAKRIEVRAYHSKMSAKERDAALEWLAYVSGPIKNKYLTAVDALSEGVNVPVINHLILARPYSRNDAIDLKRLIHNLGRGSRGAEGKAHYDVSDFNGDVHRLLFADLDEALVNGAFDAGGERDFEPFDVKPSRVERLTERAVTIDRETLRSDAFRSEVIAVPAATLGIAALPAVASTGGPMPIANGTRAQSRLGKIF